MQSLKKEKPARDAGRTGIDVALPREERIRRFVEQVEDPYRFMSGDIAANIRYVGDRTIDEVVAHWLAASDNARSAMPPDLLAS